MLLRFNLMCNSVGYCFRMSVFDVSISVSDASRQFKGMTACFVTGSHSLHATSARAPIIKPHSSVWLSAKVVLQHTWQQHCTTMNQLNILAVRINWRSLNLTAASCTMSSHNSNASLEKEETEFAAMLSSKGLRARWDVCGSHGIPTR